MSFRVPTLNVSVVDLTVHLKKTLVIVKLFIVYKRNFKKKNELKGILKVTQDELVVVIYE